MIDIHILPQKAQSELIDFYQFLVQRYASGKRKKQTYANNTSKKVSNFFDQYNVDLTGYKFDRSELYDR
jgi:hypothetical protein